MERHAWAPLRVESRDPGRREFAVFTLAYYYFYFTVRPEAQGM